MDTTNWAVQGLCIALCGWLLTAWWRESHRIVIVSRWLNVCLVIFGAAMSLYWLGRFNGINDQLAGDKSAVDQEWSARVEGVKGHIFAEKYGAMPTEKTLNSALGHAVTRSVSSDVISTRSILLLAALWLVVNFVGTVPAPAGGRPNDDANRDTDHD